MNKAALLARITESLRDGTITKNDLRAIIKDDSAKNQPVKAPSGRVSAVDVMFYIAAIVLFASSIALLNQVWDNGPIVRVLLTAGIGTVFWALALYSLRSPQQGDTRRGLTNALLFTGSLSLIAGGFIIANEFVNFNEPNFFAVAITLALLGTLHIGFGWQIKRDLITLIGVLLAVAAFPACIFGILNGSDMPMFVNSLVVAASGGLLAYATRVTSWIGASSPRAERVFDSVSVFISLMALYVASFDDGTGLAWLLVLIAGIVGLFYLSIVTQDKLMLGNGSFFLVLAIITISFRYFSGYGVATSLLISAFGLLGTAMVATTINRRYIKSS